MPGAFPGACTANTSPRRAQTALPVRVRSSRQLNAVPTGWAARTASNAVLSASATPWAPARVTPIGRPDTRLVSSILLEVQACDHRVGKYLSGFGQCRL